MLEACNPQTREDAAEIIVQLLNSLRASEAELNSKEVGDIVEQVDSLLCLCSTLDK